jgi:hypothetical protein
MNKRTGIFSAFIICAYSIIVFSSGCAQIGVPTGGDKDTLAPVLLKALPAENTRNFAADRVTLTFDEYIDVQELQKNLLVSPLQKTNPDIKFNLKTITIKFRDSLLANTTYTINFGNAIRDVHESNILKNYNYVFSTGSTIDSLAFGGKIILAETGGIDSNMIVLLYRNLDDTAVQKIKPDYITRLNGDGSFNFTHLAGGTYKTYALLDADGGKTYNARSELFAFPDTTTEISLSTPPLTMYAYAEAEVTEQSAVKTTTASPPTRANADKKLRYGTTLTESSQDLLSPLQINFNHGLKVFDSQRIVLADTNYNPIANAVLTLDSTRKISTLRYSWQPATDYLVLLPNDAVQDSAGVSLAKDDTIRFRSKRTEDYGRIVLRFNNINLALNPVLQFVQANKILYSYPITGNEWSNARFPPGEYDIRILYDDNKNGQWDPGDFSKRLQPEKAFTLPQKVGVRADWDNERDISF